MKESERGSPQLEITVSPCFLQLHLASFLPFLDMPVSENVAQFGRFLGLSTVVNGPTAAKMLPDDKLDEANELVIRL